MENNQLNQNNNPEDFLEKNGNQTEWDIIPGTHGGPCEDAAADQGDEKTKIKQENKKKLEDDQSLDHQYALLKEKLKDAITEIEQLKCKIGSQRNTQKLCKVIFELDYADNEAKVKIMKIIGGLPGINEINMDMKNKKLTLKGEEINHILMWNELSSICNTKLTYYYEYPLKEEKKEEKKKDFNSLPPCPNHWPSHQNIPMIPYHYDYEFKKVVIISLFVLLVLLIVRYAA